MFGPLQFEHSTLCLQVDALAEEIMACVLPDDPMPAEA